MLKDLVTTFSLFVLRRPRNLLLSSFFLYSIVFHRNKQGNMKLSSTILLILSILVLTSTNVAEADSNTVSDFRKETLSPNVTRLRIFTHPIVDFPF
jgi:hypothetical protein